VVDPDFLRISGPPAEPIQRGGDVLGDHADREREQRQTRIPEQLLARLSRLSAYLDILDEHGKDRLLGVVPYVHTDFSTDAMVEELARLVDTNPAVTAEVLERMLRASSPTYDLDDKLKQLIVKLAELGEREAAIRCVEMIRKTLPGTLELYKQLTTSN
jgi:hypothetical protein